MTSRRTARVASVVREVVSNCVLFELRDPRIANVTVTRVEVSGDLQHAKVYVSVMGEDKAREVRQQTQELLKAGLIQETRSPWSASPHLVKKADNRPTVRPSVSRSRNRVWISCTEVEARLLS